MTGGFCGGVTLYPCAILRKRYKEYMLNKQALGNGIRDARKRANLSQSELAKLVGPEMRQAWISQYETGARVPNYQHMSALCTALNIDQSELMQKMNGK